MLRPLKEILFMHFVDKFYLPNAKIASFLVMIPLTLLYSALSDKVEKHQLFYIFCSGYGLLFMFLAHLLASPTIGLNASPENACQLIGWIFYIGIESFIMIMLTLFWSFAASSSKTESAKRCYPLIVAVTQVASIIGPEFIKNSHIFTIPMVIFGASVSMFIIIAIVRMLVIYDPSIIRIENTKKPTGPIEGLRLVLTRPYLMAFVATTALYTMVTAILEYQLMHRIEDQFSTLAEMAKFTGSLVQTTNFVALIFALVGSSFFIRNFGVRFCMVGFPTVVFVLIGYIWLNPTLWMLFTGIVTLKSLSYALNSPCKETLYIPTSLDVQFKAKSWIDGFGYRGFLAIGASINKLFSSTISLMAFGPLLAMSMCSMWAVVAWYLGTKNNQLIAEKKIID